MLTNMDMINERCDKLISIGFYIKHLDSSVYHSDIPEVEFDFSTINLDDNSAVLYHIIRTVQKHSYEQGKQDIKQSMRFLLGID